MDAGFFYGGISMEDLSKAVQDQLDQNPFLPVYMAVVSVLYDEIRSCRLPAGTHLKENELAAACGVSRTTVRRAIDAMILEGRVIRHRPQGVEVAPMMAQDYSDTAELRQMLDSFSARLAALRRADQDLEAMQTAIVSLRTAHTTDELAAADIAFHDAIYRCTGNNMFRRIASNFNLDITHSKYLSVRAIVSIRSRIIEEHTQIFQAVADKNPDKAFQAALKHATILFDPLLLAEAFPQEGRDEQQGKE